MLKDKQEKKIPREDELLNPAMPEAEVSHASLLHEHRLPLSHFKKFELCFCHLQLEVFCLKKKNQNTAM